ncbi:porin family protein [Flagellimonas marinaquae]|uniref:porin family protein n=1 Tax=Flagellimonas marinaquae TaxID=254955 RepID=UPI0020751938|nr:porin family protein [Allomuricauda aquimarina]USD24532.1 PorT family protein [Allomuricauda aquimarina]
MKKQVSLVVLSLIAFLKVNAQDNGEFEFGIQSGLNLANVSTIDGQDNANTRISFNTGISGEYYFSDRWGLKGKLIYDSKGWADGFINDEENNNFTATNFKLNYLSIPIMANWHFGSNRNWYLNFGPYLGLLISAKDSELGIDVKEAFKSTDLGLALGIGYKFRINNNTQLFFEFDGQSGFVDIFEENLGETVRNTRSSLNFGVLFGL